MLHSRRARASAGIAAIATLVAIPAIALAAKSSPGFHTVTPSTGADIHRTSDRGYLSGPYIGHLRQGEGFRVDRSDSGHVWCIGHAYGNVDHDGNVLCGDLNDK